MSSPCLCIELSNFRDPYLTHVAPLGAAINLPEWNLTLRSSDDASLPALLRRVAQGDLLRHHLPLSSVIDHFPENSRQLLGGVEPHRIFCCHKVKAPLGLAVEGRNILEVRFRCLGFLGRHDGVQQISCSCGSALEERMVSILNGQDT
jgi:hypothetical protein